MVLGKPLTLSIIHLYSTLKLSYLRARVRMCVYVEWICGFQFLNFCGCESQLFTSASGSRAQMCWAFWLVELKSLRTFVFSVSVGKNSALILLSARLDLTFKCPFSQRNSPAVLRQYLSGGVGQVFFNLMMAADTGCFACPFFQRVPTRRVNLPSCKQSLYKNAREVMFVYYPTAEWLSTW